MINKIFTFVTFGDQREYSGKSELIIIGLDSYSSLGFPNGTLALDSFFYRFGPFSRYIPIVFFIHFHIDRLSAHVRNYTL